MLITNRQFIGNLRAMSESFKSAIYREAAMKEILQTFMPEIDISEAVQNRMKEPAFIRLALLEHAEFLAHMASLLTELESRGTFDPNTAKSSKMN